MLYSFTQPFADMVQKGIKKQTIRPIGKRKHAKPDDVLQFWTGAYRPGERRKIGEAVCSSVEPIRILMAGTKKRMKLRDIFIGDVDRQRKLSVDEIYLMAVHDGFDGNICAFIDYFGRQLLPAEISKSATFECVLIKWEKLI